MWVVVVVVVEVVEVVVVVVVVRDVVERCEGTYEEEGPAFRCHCAEKDLSWDA